MREEAMYRSTPDSSRSSAAIRQRRARRLACVVHLNDLWCALPKPLQAVGWVIAAAAIKWIAAKAGLGAEVADTLLDALRRA
jgi:hypothetical protein